MCKVYQPVHHHKGPQKQWWLWCCFRICLSYVWPKQHTRYERIQEQQTDWDDKKFEPDMSKDIDFVTFIQIYFASRVWLFSALQSFFSSRTLCRMWKKSSIVHCCHYVKQTRYVTILWTREITLILIRLRRRFSSQFGRKNENCQTLFESTEVDEDTSPDSVGEKQFESEYGSGDTYTDAWNDNYDSDGHANISFGSSDLNHWLCIMHFSWLYVQETVCLLLSACLRSKFLDYFILLSKCFIHFLPIEDKLHSLKTDKTCHACASQVQNQCVDGHFGYSPIYGGLPLPI